MSIFLPIVYIDRQQEREITRGHSSTIQTKGRKSLQTGAYIQALNRTQQKTGCCERAFGAGFRSCLMAMSLAVCERLVFLSLFPRREELDGTGRKKHRPSVAFTYTLASDRKYSTVRWSRNHGKGGYGFVMA